MARYKNGNEPTFEPAPSKPKYPTGKAVKKGSKIKCLGCRDGKTANGRCGGCEGTGYIKV